MDGAVDELLLFVLFCRVLYCHLLVTATGGDTNCPAMALIVSSCCANFMPAVLPGVFFLLSMTYSPFTFPPAFYVEPTVIILPDRELSAG